MEVIMFYAAYIHVGDNKHAHGVTLPDFPGCFSAADRWEDIQKNTQEAVEVHFEGEDLEIPTPTPLEDLTDNPNYEDGVWMMVDLDVSKFEGKTGRYNVTLPQRLV